ncbi:MAG: DinB family protein [Gemmatimonadota bacterium]|jgi:hypothetical protein|nr:DinB family protein [Gemmatimonadota bacterium]
MRPDVFASLPARPLSIAEWEDLLIRVEITPRALQHVLEELPAGADGGAAADGRSVAEHVRHLAHREAEVGGWIEALREGTPLPSAGAEPATEEIQEAQGRFTRLRARNFAAVQRRGIDVWEWAAPRSDGGTVTTFQLLGYLARHDALHLAALHAVRKALRPCG